MTTPPTIAPLYAGWHLGNADLIAVIGDLTPAQLGLPVERPIWASASHIAGARVYWLCHVFNEPGAETTPFTDPNVGWEDDLTHPRSAAELIGALASSWRIVERCLATWTPESLSQEARRARADGHVQIHTRQSVLMRLITHDAFHIGEISLVVGSNGLAGRTPNGAIDMWSGLARIAR